MRNWVLDAGLDVVLFETGQRTGICHGNCGGNLVAPPPAVRRHRDEHEGSAGTDHDRPEVGGLLAS